jgi:RNA polymerase subunit RPABC4/transcription elongation factor Spt4
MNGIELKSSIEHFGFRDGFNFWFRWIFTDPIKIFYWKYISRKPLCTEHGFFLCRPDCTAKKIYGRRNKIKYEKERHKQIEIESKTIIGSDTGICAYCGEEKGTELIDNPNWDTLERWLVCKDCKEVIENQRKLSMGVMLSENPYGEKIGGEMIKEANDKLYDISQRTGKPISNIIIDKEHGVSSVEFTGKK